MASNDDFLPGGSDADRLEQQIPAAGDDFPAGPAPADGTGGSEADRLEQATGTADDSEDGFPHGTADDADRGVHDADDGFLDEDGASPAG
ncbi:hypothetical protein [Arthrobacter sp. Br18]|uniref:hypothetical protein n=1 Tax=Arthrobacter sp. Br18 TaxID=1312954 RepID=UPI00047EFDDD|nr:hypothetical protein [Arthrobacter sp. Br18]